MFFWQDHTLITDELAQEAKDLLGKRKRCNVRGIRVFPAAIGNVIRFEAHTTDGKVKKGRIAWDGSMKKNADGFDAFARAHLDTCVPSLQMVPYTLVMDSSCGSLLEWDSGADNGGADNGGADNGGALVPLRLSMQGDTSRIPFSCLVQSAVHFYQEKKGVNPTQLVVITPPKKDVSVQSEGGIVLTCSVLVKGGM